MVWDSGVVKDENSVNVTYRGDSLLEGQVYEWVVGSAIDDCEMMYSSPAVFVTSLTRQGIEKVPFITLPNEISTFTYFRKVLEIPLNLIAATVHVTATNNDPLLAGYKLYINQVLVSAGPGRGEAAVWNGDGRFRSVPYLTHDVTSLLQETSNVVIAMECMNGASSGPQAWLRLNLFLQNGTSIVIGTDETWSVFNADKHRNPLPPTAPSSAGTAFLENINSMFEPIDWKTNRFQEKWFNAKEIDVIDSNEFTPKMEPDLDVIEKIVPAKILSRTKTSVVYDFGKEFQGGVRLKVSNSSFTGTSVGIKCGESYDSKTLTVTSTWGWEFTWVLRKSIQEQQVLEQHKYMECRFVELNTTMITNEVIELEAWVIRYPYISSDSSFRSDNSTLNAVWELARYTLEATSLDTYTDSNTRERRPYEADGIIAATSRLLVQRDVLFARHSHAWVLQNPTWPVEWKLLSYVFFLCVCVCVFDCHDTIHPLQSISRMARLLRDWNERSHTFIL